MVTASGPHPLHSAPPVHHHVHHGQRAPQRVSAPKRQQPQHAAPLLISARPCTAEPRGTPATMALITHQDGPPYAGDDPTLDRPRPNRRRQGGHASHARGGEYRESRRTRYLLLGATCMIPGLILYFGGGYLFVSAYNSRYPFVEISVDAALIR